MEFRTISFNSEQMLDSKIHKGILYKYFKLGS
jgi:hypothetical protein